MRWEHRGSAGRAPWCTEDPARRLQGLSCTPRMVRPGAAPSATADRPRKRTARGGSSRPSSCCWILSRSKANQPGSVRPERVPAGPGTGPSGPARPSGREPSHRAMSIDEERLKREASSSLRAAAAEQAHNHQWQGHAGQHQDEASRLGDGRRGELRLDAEPIARRPGGPPHLDRCRIVQRVRGSRRNGGQAVAIAAPVGSATDVGVIQRGCGQGID